MLSYVSMSVPISPEKGAIVMLAGPIKHWWNENWDTPEHWDYAAWRDALNDGLVDDGYLVYRPHEAFKGSWTERAQSVNDLVLRSADVILDMTPPGVPSLGTDAEKLYAASNGAALILPAPPTADKQTGVQGILSTLNSLNVARAQIDQEIVIESFGVTPARKWMVGCALAHFAGQIIRLHHEHRALGINVTDAASATMAQDAKFMSVVTVTEEQKLIAFDNIRKLEILARTS